MSAELNDMLASNLSVVMITKKGQTSALLHSSLKNCYYFQTQFEYKKVN